MPNACSARAWSWASALDGYRYNARARASRQRTSSVGSWKHSDLPDAVPVVTIVGPAHAAWIASAWWDHRRSMPRARSASATSGWSSSGIGASAPGRALTAVWVTSRSSVLPASSSSSQGSMSRTTTMGCQPRRVLRAAYLDMDGTLLGRGASLLHDADGAFTMLGVRALEACARAEVEVVPYSGRRQSTLLHDTRILGLRSYIFEAGCGLVLDGELESLVDVADDAGANALLLD